MSIRVVLILLENLPYFSKLLDFYKKDLIFVEIHKCEVISLNGDHRIAHECPQPQNC